MTDVDRERRVSTTGRAVVGVQLGLLVAYLIGSFGILIMAAVRADDLGAVLDPGLERLDDPKASMAIGPDSLWNPLVWIVGACRLIAWLIYPLGIAMLLFGLATLVPAVRSGDRRSTVGLALLSAIWLGLLLLAATSYGQALTSWLLD
ncbi:hypothetical protein BJY16_008093 [Actinoplanes octamycinicus]|uniref:Uncharacterized protein n=1 Tax=Actinoplanes octamycinicus TaxID=135948 RepID=A0A7W7MBZ3_9ACTN|nr:hypothetical protein [Actinoplanes octamycinicus]MBB4744634.1 hypothetical protein [Actinoplanes octamycinicus]GIE55216.1 hypothetical protein Aoc01nite_06180 [Actinoplanes octamycinicus]